MGGGSCVPCVLSWVSRAGGWLSVVEGVVVGCGCGSGDGFQALHCCRFNWVAFSVCLRVCGGCRFLIVRLLGVVGGFRVVLVGAEGVVRLSGVVSSLTFSFGCWDGIGERCLAGLGVGLVRFFVL